MVFGGAIIKFNKEHLVDIKSLTELEAREFVGFLAKEKGRHWETALQCEARALLWGSEGRRQLEEMEHIDRGIAEVNKKFGWEEK